jgi:hypothetical protein
MFERTSSVMFFANDKRPLPNRIQKTTVFIVVALAALAAAGVTTAMLTSATTADAQTCRQTGAGFVCPPGAIEGQSHGVVCTFAGGCRNIGPGA